MLKRVEIEQLTGINRNAVEGVAQTAPRELRGFDMNKAGGYYAAFAQSGTPVTSGVTAAVRSHDSFGLALLQNEKFIFEDVLYDFSSTDAGGKTVYLVPRVGVVSHARATDVDEYEIGAVVETVDGAFGALFDQSGASWSVTSGSGNLTGGASYKAMALWLKPTAQGAVVYDTSHYSFSANASGTDVVSIVSDGILPGGYGVKTYLAKEGDGFFSQYFPSFESGGLVSNQPTVFSDGASQLSATIGTFASGSFAVESTNNAIINFCGKLACVELHNQRVWSRAASTPFVGPFIEGYDAQTRVQFGYEIESASTVTKSFFAASGSALISTSDPSNFEFTFSATFESGVTLDQTITLPSDPWVLANTEEFVEEKLNFLEETDASGTTFSVGLINDIRLTGSYPEIGFNTNTYFKEVSFGETGYDQFSLSRNQVGNNDRFVAHQSDVRAFGSPVATYTASFYSFSGLIAQVDVPVYRSEDVSVAVTFYRNEIYDIVETGKFFYSLPAGKYVPVFNDYDSLSAAEKALMENSFPLLQGEVRFSDTHFAFRCDFAYFDTLQDAEVGVNGNSSNNPRRGNVQDSVIFVGQINMQTGLVPTGADTIYVQENQDITAGPVVIKPSFVLENDYLAVVPNVVNEVGSFSPPDPVMYFYEPDAGDPSSWSQTLSVNWKTVLDNNPDSYTHRGPGGVRQMASDGKFLLLTTEEQSPSNPDYELLISLATYESGSFSLVNVLSAADDFPADPGQNGEDRYGNFINSVIDTARVNPAVEAGRAVMTLKQFEQNINQDPLGMPIFPQPDYEDVVVIFDYNASGLTFTQKIQITAADGSYTTNSDPDVSINDNYFVLITRPSGENENLYLFDSQHGGSYFKFNFNLATQALGRITNHNFFWRGFENESKQNAWSETRDPITVTPFDAVDFTIERLVDTNVTFGGQGFSRASTQPEYYFETFTPFASPVTTKQLDTKTSFDFSRLLITASGSTLTAQVFSPADSTNVVDSWSAPISSGTTYASGTNLEAFVYSAPVHDLDVFTEVAGEFTDVTLSTDLGVQAKLNGNNALIGSPFTDPMSGVTWVDNRDLNSDDILNLRDLAAPNIARLNTPSTIVYSDVGFVNFATSTDQFLQLELNASTEITALVSTPAGLLVFAENETFLVRGDPSNLSSFGVQRFSATIGCDDGVRPARLGGNVFTIWKGRLYSMLLGMGDVDFGSNFSDIGAPVYDPEDPFVQVVGEPRSRQIITRTQNGRIFRYSSDVGQWFNDVYDEAGITFILPNSDDDGTRYRDGTNLVTVQNLGDSPYVEWQNVNLGDKGLRKQWRRVRAYFGDEYEGTPTMEYEIGSNSGTVTGSEEGAGWFTFTLPNGLVNEKAARLRITMAGASFGDEFEPPVVVEFVERYTRR